MLFRGIVAFQVKISDVKTHCFLVIARNYALLTGMVSKTSINSNIIGLCCHKDLILFNFQQSVKSNTTL